MSNIFNTGQSKTTQNSSNRAYDPLSSAFGSTISNGTGAGNQLAAMLGLGGTQGQSDAFKNWQNSTGYQFGLNQGVQSINGNAATTGLLNSGSTAKALDTYGQNYANTQFGNYTNQLQGLMGNGLAAGGLLGSTGQVSNQNSTASENKGGFPAALGSLLAK